MVRVRPSSTSTEEEFNQPIATVRVIQANQSETSEIEMKIGNQLLQT